MELLLYRRNETQFPVVGSTGDKINAGTVILIR